VFANVQVDANQNRTYTSVEGGVPVDFVLNNTFSNSDINSLIQQQRLAAKSDAAIATEATEAHAMIEVVDQWELDRQERIAKQGAYTAEDFRSTYTRRDNFGYDAFALSARYGCGALI
jgi:hypothetical protein